MSKNNNSENSKQTIISANTIIQFTFKGFIAIIIAILGIFLGFYKLVIQPDIEQNVEYQKEIYTQQKTYMDREFEEVKNAISINTKTIEATNERFRDLNKNFQEIANSSGSFGLGNSNIDSDDSMISSD